MEDDKEYDARISRCLGLMNRTALRKIDNKPIIANRALKKDGPFYCSMCLSDAVVRKCTEKVDHFAHHAKQSPVIKRKDKELHNLCRDQILNYLQMTFPEGNWAAEREIPANKEGYKKVVPDISGRINGSPVAIEVQASSYTVKRIADKLIEYQKRNPKIAVLYIIPLTGELGNDFFRPRLFEKYLHSVYSSRVYYWTPNCKHRLQPVHYSPAKRWIEENTWFDVELREERSEGGFWLTYRTIKWPRPSEILLDIAKDFYVKPKPPFEPKNVKKTIPACTVFKDNLSRWWDKDEYKDVKKQYALFKENSGTNFISEYNFQDDYDDNLYEDNELL